MYVLVFWIAWLTFCEVNRLMHELRMAFVIRKWYDGVVRKRLKSLHLKPRRVPLPPPLYAFPVRWMILSAILTSMWRVAMSAPVTVVRQKDSWSQVAGNMGLLDLGNILTYRRPPDPIRSLVREEEANIEDGYQKMDESELIPLPEFGKLKNLDAVQTCIP
jgi:hypothetical protein